MKQWIAFWNILVKDVRTYYLKPPNISWGLIFPLAWAGMFFIRTGSDAGSILMILPGVIAVSILFGTTSMLAVTITFEKQSNGFDRLLLAPVSLELLMLAKTAGAILFGVANSIVPILIAAFLADISGINWALVIITILLIGVMSSFLGLLVAVSTSKVFEAQAVSNFFRFPMIFLCGLFFPIAMLPAFLLPLSYILPLTYGVDILQGSIHGGNAMPYALDFSLLALSCLGMFMLSLYMIRRKWIL